MFRVDSISLEEEEEAETDVNPYHNAGVPFSTDLPHIQPCRVVLLRMVQCMKLRAASASVNGNFREVVSSFTSIMGKDMMDSILSNCLLK